MNRRLTDAMLRALADAEAGTLDPWHYGSTTIGRAKREGWIERVPGSMPARYQITAAGRSARQL